MAVQLLRKGPGWDWLHRFTLACTFPEDTHTSASVQVWEGLTKWPLFYLCLRQLFNLSISLLFVLSTFSSIYSYKWRSEGGWQEGETLPWQQMPGTPLASAHCLAFLQPNLPRLANCNNSQLQTKAEWTPFCPHLHFNSLVMTSSVHFHLHESTAVWKVYVRVCLFTLLLLCILCMCESVWIQALQRLTFSAAHDLDFSQ